MGLNNLTLISFSDLACGQDLNASKNPAPVGDNVTLSLSNPLDINLGSWLHDTGIIVYIYPGGSQSTDPRVTLNRTSSSLFIRSLRLSDSGIYNLQHEATIIASLTLSVQGKKIKIATTSFKFSLTLGRGSDLSLL